LELYRKASNKARNIIKVRKKANFDKFVDDLDPSNSSRNFWKIVKLFRNSSYFDRGSTPTTSKQELINAFINGFAPSGTNQRLADSITEFPFFFNMEFQLSELEYIIATARETSPGSDLINHSLIKLLPSNAIQILLKIYNAMLGEASFPNMWRNYDVVLLPKPNKIEFQTIVLSSCVLKMLEKLKSRFERFVELDMLLPGSQYGFRKGRSCDDCLALLLVEIYKGYISHNPVGALFLDVKGAYENVNSSILFDTINNLKIPIQYKNFMHYLINYRYVNFYKKGTYEVCLKSSYSACLFVHRRRVGVRQRALPSFHNLTEPQ